MDDPVVRLVAHARDTRCEQLSPALVDALKASLIDTVGAIVAGARAPMGRMLLQRAHEQGGRGEAVLVGTGLRVPAAEAAFANAVLGRCLELDDVHEASPRVRRGHGGHVNIAIVPAVLAALDLAPQPVSGADVLAALAVGGDLIARIRLAAGEAGRLGWEGPTVAPFGVVAAAGRVLGLDAPSMHSAMSAAYAQCAGNIQATTDGAWDVWLNAGTAARAGMLAIDLARRGYRGTAAPLLGSSGLYPLYFRGEYHEDALLGELGTFFESEHVSLKPYASCKASHNAIYTAIRLARANRLAPEDIRRITIHTSRYGLTLVGLDSAGQPKGLPRTLGEAQFHLGFAVATGIVHGAVMPDVLEAALDDPRVRALCERTEIVHLPAKDELQRERGYPPDDVTLLARDGVAHTGCETYTLGHPCNRMTRAELEDKFGRCLKLGEAAGSRIDAQAFLHRVDELEHLPDARGLTGPLA